MHLRTYVTTLREGEKDGERDKARRRKRRRGNERQEIKIAGGDTHCNENPIYVFPKKELRGLSPNIHIHVSMGPIWRKSAEIRPQICPATLLLYRLHTAILNRPLSSAATKEV